MLDRLLLGVTTLGLQGLFSLAAWTARGRATHAHGVGASGTARIVDSPAFPEHDFYVAGRTFPILARHATIGFEDDAAKDVRSLAIKFTDQPFESPLDLIMNGGSMGPFWNAKSFVEFVYASLRKEPGLERYSKKYPLAYQGAVDSLRRAPSSFAQLSYSTMIVFRFQAKDGREFLCRYRAIPEDRGEDSGVVSGDDRQTPWLQKRLPTETRPKDYLRQEYRERLAKRRVVFHLQIQLHEKTAEMDPELYNASAHWNLATHPWMDLATITLDRALSQHDNEDLRFFVGFQPPSLGLWPATSIYDYNSIGHIRSKVYPLARKTRYAAYKLRGGFGPAETPLLAEKPKEEWVVTGTLVHADRREEPLHNVVVELFDRDLVFDDRLGAATTDRAGRFEIRVDMSSRKSKHDAPDLRLVVMEVTHRRDEHDHIVQHRVPVVDIPGPSDAVPSPLQNPNGPAYFYNFGRLRVSWWEYDNSSDLPRVGLNHAGKPPQEYAPGYWPELITGAGPYKALVVAHQALAHARDPALTLERVQKEYDAIQECLTIRMERENPGSSRTDEWFGFRVLNGFNPVLPRPVAGSPGEYRVVFTWDRYETDGIHDVPNVDGRFVIDGGRFMPKQITLWFRERGQTKAFSPNAAPATYTPESPDWERARRAFRAAWNTAGECDAHLSSCHLNIEQYAIAGYRNLRLNPVRDLLFPHLREVVLINKIGDSAIFGTEGILASNTPLTADAARQRLGEHLGRLDWTGWKPRQPLCDNHQYAKIANLYWGIVSEYVREFFAENRGAIVEHWYEVWRFSEDLHRHSFPLTLDEELLDVYDTNETQQGVRKGDPGDVIRTVRPITESPEAPAQGDLDNLEQVARYVIFHATLGHTWSNDRQVEDGGEIAYGPLGLYNGSIGPDEQVLPPAMEASSQLFFAHSLNAQTRGLVLQDEDQDVPARFRELLAAKKAEFDALGYPIGRIRTRINI